MTILQLKRISILSATLHSLPAGLLLGYPLVGVMVFFQHFDPQRLNAIHDQRWWLLTLIAIPVLFSLCTSFAVLLGSLAYNSAAKLTGGVKYQVNITEFPGL